MAFEGFRRCCLVLAMAATMPGIALAQHCPRVEVAPVSAASSAETVHDMAGKAVRIGAPIVASTDIVAASTSKAEGSWGVGFNLSPVAGSRLRQFTASHVGEQVAFIIDGRARKVVKVLDPLEGNAFWISPMAKGESNRLVQQVTACLKR